MPDPSLALAIARTLNRPVVLIGMMGAGKTHLGKGLAQALNLDFYDSDSVIEAEAGASVAEIFAQQGEPAFRALEAATIAGLLAQGPAVISTGGGAVTTPATLQALKAQAYSVWVEASLPDMLERVSRSKNRPLLANADPAAVLARLLDRRKALYAEAAIHITNRNDASREALEDILKGLAKALKIS
jgi:shikimate kinase